jgi:hypothetical protein
MTHEEPRSAAFRVRGRSLGRSDGRHGRGISMVKMMLLGGAVQYLVLVEGLVTQIFKASGE